MLAAHVMSDISGATAPGLAQSLCTPRAADVYAGKWAERITLSRSTSVWFRKSIAWSYFLAGMEPILR